MNIDSGVLAACAALAQIVVTIGGGFYFMGRVTGRLDFQDVKIGMIQKDVSETKNLVTASAVHETRIGHMEADIQNVETDVRRLRRGVGWIRDADAQSVDREY